MARFYAHFNGDELGSLYDQTGEHPEGWLELVAWLRANGQFRWGTHLLNPRVVFGVFF